MLVESGGMRGWECVRGGGGGVRRPGDEGPGGRDSGLGGSGGGWWGPGVELHLKEVQAEMMGGK